MKQRNGQERSGCERNQKAKAAMADFFYAHGYCSTKTRDAHRGHYS